MKSPHNGRAFMNLGRIRMDQEDPLSAIGYLVRGQALAPHDPDIEINLARAYNIVSRTVEAEIHFKKAIADGPHTPPHMPLTASGSSHRGELKRDSIWLEEPLGWTLTI